MSFWRSWPWLCGILFFACDAFARAGGGHSFSGGGGHGSGGYGGGGGGINGFALAQVISIMIDMTFDRPVVGVPIDFIVIYFAIMIVRARGSDHTTQADEIPRAMTFRREDLQAVLADDAKFSFAYFADFTNSLFAEVHKARGLRKLGNYSSYLSEVAMAKLKALSPLLQECRGIVVGGWHIVGVRSRQDGLVEVRVEFEANYSEIIAGRESRWYVKETWIFTRQAGTESKAPAELTALGCPNCGAPLEYSSYRVCKACGSRIESGEFNWFVSDMNLLREARPPLLTSQDDEDGTDLPTQYARNFEEAYASYLSTHAEFNLPAFIKRTEEVFFAIQKAWSERQWEHARPYVSDRLFQTNLYWIEEYKRQGLRNALSGVQVYGVEPVSLSADPFVISFTVRIFAAMIDVTVNETGQVLSGDPRSPHKFTEYWTFIRGQTAPNKPLTPFGFCPSCGAQMKVGMAGTCEYCGNKITTGDFDWVLSMIEQDEAYEA